MKNLIACAALVSLTMLVACSTNDPVPETPPAQTTTNTGAADDANAVVDETAATGVPAELQNARVIYFDFDRADIRSDSQATVAAHARYLAANPAVRARLEGHADERGSREYNIGLGERRGQAVRRALLLQGVAEVQLSTVSYGEERPAEAGSTEQAYGLNRRVEIIYIK
jgi:peptidoglycan-associated lipoprotein